MALPKLPDWDEYKSELVVSNFESTEIERFIVIPPLGMEYENQIFGNYFGGVPFWERNLSDEDLKKLIQYFYSGLAFRMEYFVLKGKRWETIRSSPLPFEKHVKDLEEKFKKQAQSVKDTRKTYALLSLFMVVLFIIAFVTQK